MTLKNKFVVHGNVVSDLTNHFSQFCISLHPTSRILSVSPKVQDYANFSPKNFNNDLTQISWDIITVDTHQHIDKNVLDIFTVTFTDWSINMHPSYTVK